MTNYLGKWYHPFLVGTIQNSKKPENSHLCIETAVNTLYFVDSSNNKVLLKTTDKGTTVETVETRTNKDIARCWFDRDNNIIYFVDCEFDNTTSYVWKLNLSDDSVVEITSKSGDIFDIFMYDSEVSILYFVSSGYTLEQGDIVPDGDITTEWTSTGANHFTEIDEDHSAPNTADKITNVADAKVDSFTMGTIDMTGYDSAGAIDQVYQIDCYIYTIGGSGSGVYMTGNKTGMTKTLVNVTGSFSWKKVTWSGLSLDQADLNDLEIELESNGANGSIVATMYCVIYFYGDNTNTNVVIENLDTSDQYTNDMGAMIGRSWDISQYCIVDTDFYFLFKWSDENVEIWRFRTVEEDFTEMEDCGSTTELPTVQQGAISFDDVDVLYFVLGTGTAEVSTIVADIQANINDESYFTIYVISLDYENVRSEYTINCWFDKVGDSTWTNDPADADENIQIDISGDVTAQDVSDSIQAALDSHELVTAANGSGTSTTVTITNHYNGSVTNIDAQDSGLSVAVSVSGVDNVYYLYTYEITDDTLTQIGEYDIVLMLNRSTNIDNQIPFNLEKGFEIERNTDDDMTKIFKISKGRGNLYAVASVVEASDVIAITDKFIILNNASLYKWVDASKYIGGRSVIRAIQRNYWSCEMYVRTTGSLGDYNIFDGMFIQIIGNLSAQCNTGTLSYFGAPDNFNDEAVGTQGTSIGFVDSATLYDGQVEIVSSWQSHKNVLRFLDDATAGEDPTFTHNMTASTANTVEIYVGTNDVTELWLFGLYDSSVPDYIVKLRITASNLDYLDSLDAWQSVQAVANDTLYHVKIIWRADNTFDVYVDETIKVTNQATNNNQSSGVDQFIVTAEGDSTDYLYFDAWGDISDSDYYVGRNLIKTKENAILYEGYARFSDLKDPRKIWIDSPALRDLKNKIFPGSYSGNTDAILSDIFDDSFNYITAGTMSSGTAMGTVYFRGSKKGKRIIDNYAQIDSFTWVIKCDDGQGLLNYNDGSVNSHITITEADKLGWYGGKKIRDIVNQVNLKGAINPDTGKPFESTYNNKASQKIYGIQPIFRTYAQIDDQTILNNLAQAIGTIAAQAPFQYKFSRKARFEGLNLPIETLNFAYSPESISALDRIIHSFEYYWRTGLIIYQIIDAL